MGLRFKNGQQDIGRNDPCFCKSGLKFKWCHGDKLKQAVCNRVANEKMAQLIIAEKFKKGMICSHGVDINEHCKECKIGDI